MPTIGLDAQILLDGSGYFIEPTSFAVKQPRIRRAELTRTPAAAGASGAGSGERYVDQGPGKREWSFTILAFQSIRTYAGTMVTLTGQQYRDAVHTSYQKVNTTLAFTDPNSQSWTAHFDDLHEEIDDVRAQNDGELQYYLHVTLTEA
jgi:hypothetical protein